MPSWTWWSRFSSCHLFKKSAYQGTNYSWTKSKNPQVFANFPNWQNFSESNPCGSGNEVTCTCADGASFTPRWTTTTKMMMMMLVMITTTTRMMKTSQWWQGWPQSPETWSRRRSAGSRQGTLVLIGRDRSAGPSLSIISFLYQTWNLSRKCDIFTPDSHSSPPSSFFILPYPTFQLPRWRGSWEGRLENSAPANRSGMRLSHKVRNKKFLFAW